jgi:hypothetical protein
MARTKNAVTSGAHRPTCGRLDTATRVSTPTPPAPAYSRSRPPAGSRDRVIPAALPSARTVRSNGSHLPRRSLAQLSASASNGAPSGPASPRAPARASDSDGTRPESGAGEADRSHQLAGRPFGYGEVTSGREVENGGRIGGPVQAALGHRQVDQRWSFPGWLLPGIKRARPRGRQAGSSRGQAERQQPPGTGRDRNCPYHPVRLLAGRWPPSAAAQDAPPTGPFPSTERR